MGRPQCAEVSCKKHPSFNEAGTARGLFCLTHARPGMVNVYSKKCVIDGCTKQVSYGNIVGNGKLCTRHAAEEKAKILNSAAEEKAKILNSGEGRAQVQDHIGQQLIDGTVGSIDGERKRKRSHPSGASPGANEAVGPNGCVRAKAGREATMQPLVSKRLAIGTSSELDEAEASTRQKGCPEPLGNGNVSLKAGASTNTFSRGIDAVEDSTSSRRCALGCPTLSLPQQATAEKASCPSSSSRIVSSSDDGASVTGAAAATADSGNEDDCNRRAETDSSRGTPAAPGVQRGGSAAPVPRKTAKMSVVELASLVLEAWAEGEEEEEEPEMDEGLPPRLASVKRAAAVNFVNAAATVLGMARASERRKP